jgi:hypothetical protein
MKHQRKRIWIHSFQTGLLIRIAGYCVLCQVAAWAFVAVGEQINATFQQLGVESPLFSNPLLRILLPLLVLVPPFVLDAIQFAHRLVGPLYRFRKTIQAIAAGEPVALVNLRKGDQLMDFKDDFNLMLKALEQKGLIVLQAPAASATAATPAAAGSLTPAAAHPSA